MFEPGGVEFDGFAEDDSYLLEYSVFKFKAFFALLHIELFLS